MTSVLVFLLGEPFMTDDKIVRKIAVIFVTDIVGFSKLMEKK